MLQIQSPPLIAYEENTYITKEISDILSSDLSLRQQRKHLKKLQHSVTTELSHEHIEYHLQKIHTKQFGIFNHLFAELPIWVYLIFMLYRAYYDFYPEKAHYSFVFDAPSLTTIVLLIPIFLVLYYCIRFIVYQKILDEKYLKIGGLLFGIIIIVYIFTNKLEIIYIPGTITDVTEPVTETYSDEYTPSSMSYETSSLDPHTSKAFVGTWTDSYSQRCWLTIEHTNDIYYDINIQWSSSASEYTEWKFYGVYDAELGGITYTGDQIHGIFTDDGNSYKEFVYTDGSGLFYLDQDNNLYWDDYKENAGEYCIFQKEELEIDTDWHYIYQMFNSVAGDITVEICCQNDVMLWLDLYVGTEQISWVFDVEPSEIGPNGELIYTNEYSVVLTYYPDDHHISIDNNDGLFATDYYPVI